MNIKITACIVTYNNADKIVETIRSIYESIGENITLYISDNSSSDDTVALVKKNFPQAIVIENRNNKGFGYGNNVVLPLLESQLHFIINPDITVSKNTFEQFVDYFEKSPEVVMAVPKFLYENGDEQFTPKLTPKLHYMLGGRLEKLGNPFKRWRDEYTLRNVTVTEPIEVGFCSGCFICIRTDILKKIGGFDERYFLYSEDADLTREAKKFGKTMYNPKISVVHKWERGYTKNHRLFFVQIQSMIKYFWKWRK